MKLAMMVLAAMPLAAAGDISGKWTIEGDVAGNPVNMDCSIQQNAEAKIAGKCTLKGNDGPETVDIAGDAKGEKFKFSFTAGGYTLDYSGTQEGDAIKGDIEVAGVTGTFTGKRSPE